MQSVEIVPVLALENGGRNFIPGDISKKVDGSHRGTDPLIAAATGYLPAFDGRFAEQKTIAAFGRVSTPHPELAPFLLLGRILQSSNQNSLFPLKQFEDKLRMETSQFIGPRNLVTSQPVYAGVRPFVDRQRHLETQRALRQQGLRPYFSTNALQQQQLNVQNSPPASYSIHSSPEPPRNLNGQIEVPVRDSLRDPHHIGNQNGRYESLVRDSPHHIGNQDGRYQSLVRDSPQNIGNQNGRYESLVRDSPHHSGNQNGRYETLVPDSPHYIGKPNGRYEALVHDSPHHIGDQNGRFDASVRGSWKDLSLLDNQNGRKPSVNGPLPDRHSLTNQNGKHDDLAIHKPRPISESDSWNHKADSLQSAPLDILGRPLPVYERPMHSRYVVEKDPRLHEHSHGNRESRYSSFQNEAPRASHLPYRRGSDPIERQRVYNTDYDRSVAAQDEDNTTKPVPPRHQYGAENQSDTTSPVWKDEERGQRHLELQPQNAERKKKIRKRKRRPEEDI